jgi:zinc transporter ZupT
VFFLETRLVVNADQTTLIAGLATFVAAMEDPAVGAMLAIAIAIHNIPEGKACTCS